MKEKYLPIGTVVELNDVDMKVYIAGYCSESSNRQGYVYDYSEEGCCTYHTSTFSSWRRTGDRKNQILTYIMLK